MIEENETIEKYMEYNKIYIPQEYNNENYKYTISNDEITIITNNNCRTQYSTTYCTCYRYNERYNIVTEGYECNANPSNYIINYDYITSDINYSNRIVDYYFKNYGITFLIIITALIFFKALKGSI